ncbi:FecCD family ABC transporter permease [Halotalea alkalilenta]|uniref:FecCD family ABC transporter permease n=1 Tax=Halotalea alkalilenta TaxID=376489 RepID=UPI000485049F|nr:iron ABC transporter permease [Halotalea alkalilenta]
MSGGQARPETKVLVLLGLLALALMIGASSGVIGLSPRLLFGDWPDALGWQVWWQLRLPRLLLGVLIGAMLAAGGAAMQGLFRNPLADPTLLGLANGAGLAVAALIVLGGGMAGPLGLYAQFLAGFIGALVVSALVFQIGRRYRGREAVVTLLLAGLAINVIAGAGGGLLAFIASDEQLRQLSLWGMGSLAHALWPATLAAMVLLPLALLGLARCARGLDLLQLGELTAHAAGLDAQSLRRRVILAVSLGVGASVALAGIIGFIGLLVPHVLRLWMGPGHRLLLPASMVGGALLLVVADTLARTMMSPAEVPVGLLTSLLGGPYFLWLLLRRRRTAME